MTQPGPRFTLPNDMALAMPGRHRWDLRLVEPEPEPVTPAMAPLALTRAIEQAEHEALWATSSRAYQDALDRLASLRRGERVAVEPAPPVPTPPMSSPGTAWQVTKVIQRDGASGLITGVEQTWRPAATSYQVP
jgi:hypothetical protein